MSLLCFQLELVCEGYKLLELRMSVFEDNEQIEPYWCSNLVRQFLKNFDYVHDSVLTCTQILFSVYKSISAHSQMWTWRLISFMCLLRSLSWTFPPCSHQAGSSHVTSYYFNTDSSTGVTILSYWTKHSNNLVLDWLILLSYGQNSMLGSHDDTWDTSICWRRSWDLIESLEKLASGA